MIVVVDYYVVVALIFSCQIALLMWKGRIVLAAIPVCIVEVEAVEEIYHGISDDGVCVRVCERESAF